MYPQISIEALLIAENCEQPNWLSMVDEWINYRTIYSDENKRAT